MCVKPLDDFHCTFVERILAGENLDKSVTYWIRAGHARLVLSICPLPSLVVSNLEQDQYLEIRLTIIVTCDKKCSRSIILIQEIKDMACINKGTIVKC
jgi:hypothetical protein